MFAYLFTSEKVALLTLFRDSLFQGAVGIFNVKDCRS